MNIRNQDSLTRQLTNTVFEDNLLTDLKTTFAVAINVITGARFHYCVLLQNRTHSVLNIGELCSNF